MSLRLVFVCAMCIGAGWAGAPAARADDTPVEQQIIDAMSKAFGTFPQTRANHAKGVVLSGHFVGDTGAARYTISPLFSGQTMPVIVRFSDSTGLPAIPDGSPDANPHGMAIKFKLPSGGESDMVLNSLQFFPVANGEEFRDLLLAVADSPESAPHPNKLEQFMKAHPAAPTAFASTSTPASFATETYNGIDSFIFVNKSGEKQPVRYRVTPAASEHLSREDAAKRPPDFLMQEIEERVAKGPVTFTLQAVLARPGDPVEDATKKWPDDREVVTLGKLTIDKAVAKDDPSLPGLLFLPGNLTDGIEPSADPIIDVRNGSYAISFSRRQ